MTVISVEDSDYPWVTSNANIPPDAREVVVTGLRPAKFYQFHVLASNEVGESQPSDPKPEPPIEMPQQRMIKFNLNLYKINF